MNRFRISTLASTSLIAIFAGCATTPKVDPNADRNRDMGAALHRARGELESCMRDRDMMNQRLAALSNEADSLRAQLNQRPEPAAAPPGWTAVPGGGMIAIEEGILFSPGKVTLRDEARKALDSVVSTLEGEYRDKDIMVFGHTDDRPIKKSGWQDNWQLSTERSLAVTRYLRERGVDATRLVAAGCGENRPRAANNTEPNRLANRRVEIFAIDAQPHTGRNR